MKILVFQHLAVQHPGTFTEIWKANGDEWTTVELDTGDEIPDMEGFDLLVVMGGPMDVWDIELHPWLVAEKRAIGRWVIELKRPFLGICFGHQLLADVLGGKVVPMAMPEVGVVRVSLTLAGESDPVLLESPTSMEVLTWHGAEVFQLPPGAVTLASNEACAVQAMRWGLHAYGFQYNVEITPRLLIDWSKVPAYQLSLDQALGQEGAAGLLAEIHPLMPEFRARAERIESNLAALIAAA